MNLLVIAPVLLPLLAGILLLLLPQSRLCLHRTLSVVAVAAQIGLTLALMTTVSDGRILIYALGNWPPPFGIVLVADRLAAWMLVITALLALFALVVVWGFSIAFRSQHHFGRLLALGVTAMMFLYVFINTAMVMGLLPVVGVPLPLVSNGGTAMVSVMFACGLLIGVNVYRDAQLPRAR